MNQNKVTLEQARRVLEVVDAGLVYGMGTPTPGKMCVEAAVCFALGLPHSDNPPCVAGAVRSFKIALNDKTWSSPAARAKGMRRVAIAQLGSRGEIDEKKFLEVLAEKTIRRVVPVALRAAASRQKDEADKTALEAAAVRCEQEGTKEASRAAETLARKIYWNSAAAAAAYAAYAAAAAAYAAADAAADDAADAARDKVLSLAAECCVEALREVGSPGVALMDELGVNL